MGPVSIVSTQSGGPSNYLTQAASEQTVSPGSSYSGAALTSSSEASTVLTITNVQSAATELLQGLDSKLADNEMLRMIIGLMILMALLQSLQSEGEATNRAWSDLGRNGDSSPLAGAFASSTTIQIEQSVSTSITLEAFSAVGFSEADTQPPGGLIDVSA